jgi:hypothetical protein
MIKMVITLKMDAVIASETSVSLYQTEWRNIPGDSHLREFIYMCLKSFFVTEMFHSFPQCP